ncbi:MAG: HAMP domain-containing sensor histidine kinase [Brevundimonas sp.]
MRRFLARSSLLRVLFVAIIGVSMTLYFLFQLLEPNPEVPLLKRFTVSYVAHMVDDNGGGVVTFISLLMLTVGVLLQLALQPVRRLSNQARRIGPANLAERLPVDDAPREIAPLVAAFNSALDRLEDASKAQRAFSANVAHELRTPLAALRAQVESLLPSEHRREASAEFDRLSRIISQLLTLSEGEHAALRQRIAFDLAVVVEETTRDCAPAFVQSGREISLDRADVATVERTGDPVLIGLALRNLLENALKHTPPGTRVMVSLTSEGVVSVSDEGPGLPSDFLDRAFQPFTRVDRRSAGAGLGLSIVTRIVQLHGGEVWTDALNPGVAFRMRFPLAT